MEMALDAESQHAIERLVQLAGQHEMIERAGELMALVANAQQIDQGIEPQALRDNSVLRQTVVQELGERG